MNLGYYLEMEAYRRPSPWEDKIDRLHDRARARAKGKPTHVTSDYYLKKIVKLLETEALGWSDVAGSTEEMFAAGLKLFLDFQEAYPLGERLSHNNQAVFVDGFGFDHESSEMKVRLGVLDSISPGGEFRWVFVSELENR